MKINPIGHLAKTNPNKAKFKKAKMNVTSIITKAYENKTPIRAPKKQSQISKRQKRMQPSLPQRIMKKTAFSCCDKTNPNKPNFTSAGWNFVTIPVWKMNCEGMSYPKLSWRQPMLGDFGCPDGVNMRDFVVLAEQARRPKKPFTIDLKNLSQLTYKTFRFFAKSPQIGFLKAVLRLFCWIKTAFAV